MKISGWKQTRLSSAKGAAAVEFALVLPFLMALICGTIEFGLLFYNKQVVVNASREAARTGITAEGRNNVQVVATTYCAGRLVDMTRTPGAPTVTAGWDAQNDLTVQVAFTYNLFFAQFIGIPTVNVTGRTVMRIEP